MIKYSVYKDKIHGIIAVGTSTTMAWSLIRNECHAKNWIVPMMDEVEFIRDLDSKETDYLKIRMKNEAS